MATKASKHKNPEKPVKKAAPAVQGKEFDPEAEARDLADTEGGENHDAAQSDLADDEDLGDQSPESLAEVEDVKMDPENSAKKLGESDLEASARISRQGNAVNGGDVRLDETDVRGAKFPTAVTKNKSELSMQSEDEQAREKSVAKKSKAS